MLLAHLLLYRFSRSRLNPWSDPITQDLAPFSTPEDLPYQPYLRALSNVLPRPKTHFAYISNDFGRLKQGLRTGRLSYQDEGAPALYLSSNSKTEGLYPRRLHSKVFKVDVGRLALLDTVGSILRPRPRPRE